MKTHKKIISLILILVAAFLLNTSITFAATLSTPSTIEAASAGYNSIKVSWGVVSGVNGYEVYRATSLEGAYSFIAKTTSTSYLNTGLTTGKTYYYKVKTYKTSGTTKVYSKYTSTINAKPIPSTPANLSTASAGYNSTKLSWTKVSGASGYEVYRATSSTGTYSNVKTTTTTSYTNTSLTTGNTYYYKVRVYKTVGTTKVYSKFSTIMSAKPIPSTPININITSVSDTSSKISWSAVSGASGYEIQRSVSSTGTYSRVTTTTALSYTNTELTGTKIYYYKIRAYRMVGKTKVFSKLSDAEASPSIEVNSGNISNLGLIAKQGNIIYYSNLANSGYLSKVNVNGTGVTKLCDDVPFYINVVNDWIYYSNISKDSYSIYKIKNDGTGRTLITSNKAQYINVVEDWIYYVNGSDHNTIYKIKTNGTGSTKLSTPGASFINVAAGWIYYTDATSGNALYKIKTDGTGCKKLSSDDSNFINVVGDWIYYVNYSDTKDSNGSIFKIKTDGTNRVKLLDCMAYGLVVSENYIYYIHSWNMILSRAKIDGKGSIILTDQYDALVVNVAGSKIYFLGLSGDYPLYSADTSGANISTFGLDTVVSYVSDQNEIATQGDIYDFASTVPARMSDGSDLMIPVTWNSHAIDTSNLASYVYTGTVKGYSKKITLSVEVVERGNTNGNGVNRGLVAEKDGWLYYKNNPTGKLYKIKSDGTNISKICDDTPNCINVIGEWIYYINALDEHIYKIKTNGTGRTELTDDTVSQFVIAGNEIYYINSSDYGYIYSINIDGTERTQCNKVQSSNLNIAGGSIYFSADGIYKVRKDYPYAEKLTDDRPKTMVVDNGYVYYINESGGYYLYQIKTDGTGKTVINEDNTFNFNIREGWIYYSNRMDSDKLYKMKTDGTGKIKLNDDNLYDSVNWTSEINLAGNQIYYQNFSDNGNLYYINDDGTGRQIFGNDNKIATIDDVYVTTTLGDSFKFPSDVVATMSDDSHLLLPVIWNSYDIDTSVGADFTYTGTVEGYSNHVILHVLVSEKGNTNGNNVNGGMVAGQDSWIYYKNNSDGKLYKINEDGTERTKICDDIPSCINVLGDWIYYINSSDRKIYKIKTDGTGRVKVVDDKTNQFVAAGDRIYFLNASDNYKIYSVKTDGTERIKLNNVQSNNLNIISNQIYFSTINGIYSLRNDGMQLLKITDDFSERFIVVDGYVYYINISDGYKLYKIKTDGTEKTKINDDWALSFNVSDGWIYYSNNSDSDKIYKVMTNGTEKMKLSDVYNIRAGISVIGDWVYYNSYNDNDKLYSIKNDGTGNMTFGVDTTIASINAINATVYFGASYTLPSTVLAIMGDGYRKDVPVVWNSSALDTSKAGTYPFEGTVDGFTPIVTLTVDVIQNEEYGSTSGNMVNGYYTTEYQGWIYYINFSDSNSIYKVNADGTGRTKLGSATWCYTLNVASDWVYYTSNKCIYKMTIDGSSSTKILDGIANNILVVDHWIYFRNSIDNCLYKIMTDGNDMTKITSDKINEFYVSGGWVYYGSNSDHNKLYKIRTNGTDKVKISDNSLNFGNIIDSYIYSFSGNELYRMNLDGSGKTIITDSCQGFLNVYDGWIYYRNDYKLYKIKTDGSNKTLLYNSDISTINVSGGWIYFYSLSNTKYYQMKTDGTTLKLMIQ